MSYLDSVQLYGVCQQVQHCPATKSLPLPVSCSLSYSRGNVAQPRVIQRANVKVVGTEIQDVRFPLGLSDHVPRLLQFVFVEPS